MTDATDKTGRRVVPADFDSPVEIAWCPGCGNFAILAAVRQALVNLNLPPDRVLMCSGIGQAPKLPHYLTVNTFNGLHGREVASATGAKLAADDLTVIVHAGDGGAYGEGGNHLLAAIRRNINLTVIVHDNKVYGLTKGQASPTTEEGPPAKLQPRGLAVHTMNPLALALSQGCGFVAQGFAGDGKQLTGLITSAMAHRGLSLINILQPCVTWDKQHTYDYYREHCRPVGGDYDPGDLIRALDLLLNPEEAHIPTGVLYQKERQAYEEIVLTGLDHPLRDRELDPAGVQGLFQAYR